jgi:mannose-6-phosphate isomerase-like protein (cupin superfamily)
MAEIKIVDKDWGHEEWLVNEEKYCGKFLYLKKGKRCSLHYHQNKDETFYINKGKVLMEILIPNKIENKIFYSPERRIMKEGDRQHITPGMQHRFSGLEDSVIIEFSTHHEDTDSYRSEKSGDVPQDIMEHYK